MKVEIRKKYTQKDLDVQFILNEIEDRLHFGIRPFTLYVGEYNKEVVDSVLEKMTERGYSAIRNLNYTYIKIA